MRAVELLLVVSGEIGQILVVTFHVRKGPVEHGQVEGQRFLHQVARDENGAEHQCQDGYHDGKESLAVEKNVGKSLTLRGGKKRNNKESENKRDKKSEKKGEMMDQDKAPDPC